MLPRYSFEAPRSEHHMAVLHAALHVPSGDPDATLNGIIGAALDWAESKKNHRIPAALREGRTHYAFEPGVPNAIRYTDGERDIWALQVRNRDANANRDWITEITCYRLPHGIHLTLRLGTYGLERLAPDPATPAVLRMLTRSFALHANGIPLAERPTAIIEANDFEAFAAHLTNPERTLPLIVVTLPRDASAARFDAAPLQRATFGIAHVVTLAPRNTHSLTERVGPERTVFGGSVRLYQPGFSVDADPREHPLFFPDHLATAADRAEVERLFRVLAANASLRHVRIGVDLQPFSRLAAFARDQETAKRDAERRARAARFEQTARAMREQVEVANARLRDTTTTSQDLAASLQEAQQSNEQLIERLAYLDAELERVTRERDERMDLAEQYFAEATDYAQQLENTKASLSRAEAALASYRQAYGQLRAQGSESTAPRPVEYRAIPTWVDEVMGGKLALTTAARAALKKAHYQHIEVVLEALEYLAGPYRDARLDTSLDRAVLQGFRSAARGVLVENARTGGDEFGFDHDGARYQADWHLKHSNDRDPTRILRVYYAWCDATQRVIVAHLPGHITNANS